jgi:hypothetical protein
MSPEMLKTAKEVILLHERRFYNRLPFNQSVDTCRVADEMLLSCKTPQWLQTDTELRYLPISSQLLSHINYPAEYNMSLAAP